MDDEAADDGAKFKFVNTVEAMAADAHASSSSEPEIMQNTNHNKCDSMQRVRVRRRRWRIIAAPENLFHRAVSPKVFILCSVVLLYSTAAVSGFNVDVGSRVVHSGPRRSCDRECMFGFAVAQHRERGVPW